MKTCKLCHHAIESWQSWQIDNDDYAHLACLLGETPRAHPIERLKTNENIRFTPNESHRYRSVDSDAESS